MKAGRDEALGPLEHRLGHRFNDRELILTALTHASAASTRDTYQRLEFLGDRVLGLIVTEILLKTYPEATEGDLSRRLAELVRKEACAEVATALDMGGALRFGGGATQRAALMTTNVLADVCEAVIAAIYLDGGITAARKFISANWKEKLLTAPGLHGNAKAALQEWAQGKGLGVPDYTITTKSGPDHEPHFEVETKVGALKPARGAGRTRREAEQAAAGVLLKRERVWKEKP